jgi:hypothetical protein
VLGRPFLTIEQMAAVLWPKPIATPVVLWEYPDVLRGPLQPYQWNQFYPPQTIIPTVPLNVIWLGPKPVLVPILTGRVIAPAMAGAVMQAILGKKPVP